MELPRHNTASNLSALLLFSIFIVSSILLALSGADICRDVSDGMTAGSTLRSSSAYLTNKLRSCGDADAVSVGCLEEEGDLLLIREEYDGEGYYTRIYQYDGWLRESFLWEMSEFDPADGERITEISDFSVSAEDGCVRFSFGYETAPPVKGAVTLRADG